MAFQAPLFRVGLPQPTGLLKIKRDCSRVISGKDIVSHRPTKGKDTMTTQLSERETKALEIAARTKLIRKGNTWIVPSQSGPKKYTVDPNPESPRCTCPDFEFRQERCKHIYAVEITLQHEVKDDGKTRTVTETVTVKRKYTQDWANYNKAQTTEKSHFPAFLYELCSKIEEPIKKRSRGRQPLPLGRRALYGDVQSLLHHERTTVCE